MLPQPTLPAHAVLRLAKIDKDKVFFRAGNLKKENARSFYAHESVQILNMHIMITDVVPVYDLFGRQQNTDVSVCSR